MAYVKIKAEVPGKLIENDWNLCFQKVTYHYDDGGEEDGFRFIWRRPNGNLQAARGQARIESLEQMMALIEEAKESKLFD